MSGLRKRWLLTAALLLAVSPAVAWAPETRVYIIDEATRLMPESLRLVLERHRESVLRGALTPLTHEDDAEHRPPWSAGRLDDRVSQAAAALVDSLDQPSAFAPVAVRFGELAHYVTDATFPPGVSHADGGSRYAHFAGFCESRRERFPLVFYGHDDADLDDGDFAAFARRVMEQAASDDRRLAFAYERAGDPPDPAAFDDRSVPFAVGSLAYSRAVTHLVRAWLRAWQDAGGDMGRTPYWKLPRGEGD